MRQSLCRVALLITNQDLAPPADGQETFILCRSADRGEKEKAIRERFAARIIEAVTRLQRRLRRARKP
ncbi:MAG TPA: hypothetical protein VNE39_08720, partial [Planctomycetota bacterium]|nr:hypothetical protein [Planctomycetota bacterium]